MRNTRRFCDLYKDKVQKTKYIKYKRKTESNQKKCVYKHTSLITE